MGKVKTGFKISGSLIVILAIIFALGLAGLAWKAFFKPKHENIERRVFENTKSYTHGMSQELAKHYSEYQKGTATDKKIIRNVIKSRFADFDETKLRTQVMRDFLFSMRSY